MGKNTDLVVLEGWPIILTGEEAMAVLEARKLDELQNNTNRQKLKKKNCMKWVVISYSDYKNDYIKTAYF